MLASIPVQPTHHYTTTNSGWPLNEVEENIMTLATSRRLAAWRSLKSTAATVKRTVVRCNTCQRRFHSAGNLANHQQLYQH
jgi:hypothetical protein